MGFEKFQPNNPDMSERPEFDLLNLSEEEQSNPVVVIQALFRAQEMVGQWGRNSDEMSEIITRIKNLQLGQSDPKETYRWLTSLVNSKQDYN